MYIPVQTLRLLKRHGEAAECMTEWRGKVFRARWPGECCLCQFVQSISAQDPRHLRSGNKYIALVFKQKPTPPPVATVCSPSENAIRLKKAKQKSKRDAVF